MIDSEYVNFYIFRPHPIYLKDDLQKGGGTNLFAVWKSVRHVDMSP